MLIQAERSCLLVIDLQEKLMAAIPDSQQVIANSAWLIQIATRLEIPLLASEQYPRGLGYTVPAVRELLPESVMMEKTCFSCTAEPACRQRIDSCKREQWILVGAETHVCVLQTALGLLESGKAVYVVADGTASRRSQDAETALARLRAEGVRVVTREMVAFEWLHRAGTEQFREISQRFLK
jgi:nicotinamidase-related amidase